MSDISQLNLERWEHSFLFYLLTLECESGIDRRYALLSMNKAVSDCRVPGRNNAARRHALKKTLEKLIRLGIVTDLEIRKGQATKVCLNYDRIDVEIARGNQFDAEKVMDTLRHDWICGAGHFATRTHLLTWLKMADPSTAVADLTCVLCELVRRGLVETRMSRLETGEVIEEFSAKEFVTVPDGPDRLERIEAQLDQLLRARTMPTVTTNN